MKRLLIPFLFVLGLALMGTAQCERSRDPMSPSLGTESRDAQKKCEHGCDMAFKRDYREEKKRHHKASQDCDDDAACLDQEVKLHEGIMGEMAANYDACLVACSHEQGGGRGGQ